jgi:hypothetical protein
MSKKYIFKLIEKKDEILFIIQDDSLIFMVEINELTFNLPYISSKNLTRFLSKVIDKFNDKTLRLDYIISQLDANNLLFKVIVWDGKTHTFDIKLKSKEIRDAELIDNKINTTVTNIKKFANDEILKVNRKYDSELKNTSENILNKYNTNNYRNYKFKSIKIIKAINKVNRSIDILEEFSNEKYFTINDIFYDKVYDELKKYDHFNQYIHSLFKNKLVDLSNKVYYIKKYFVDISIYNILEIILNNYGVINIIHLNLEYNKATSRIILDIKFLYDDSETRIYKCFPSLFKQNIEVSKMIYNNYNAFNKKDKLDIFIFEKLK